MPVGRQGFSPPFLLMAIGLALVIGGAGCPAPGTQVAPESLSDEVSSAPTEQPEPQVKEQKQPQTPEESKPTDKPVIQKETPKAVAEQPPQTPLTSTPIPTPTPTPAPAPEPPPPKLVNGKTVEERVQEASDRLHTVGSGQQIRDDFPDVQLVYTDPGDNKNYPPMILPFRYYYSQEADRTFNICNIDLTVFICTGKLDRVMTGEDASSGRCVVTPVYGQQY